MAEVFPPIQALRVRDRRWTLLGVPTLLVAITGLAYSASQWRGAGITTAPSQTVEITVRAGHAYAFPWIDVPCTAHTPGCFTVEAISTGGVTILFPRFEVQYGRPKASGFVFRTAITPEGTEYELFRIILRKDLREAWIYAALKGTEGNAARLKFLRYPSWVSRNAMLTREVRIDLRQGMLEETTRIQAPEPVTLMGLRRVDRMIPGATLKGVTLDGRQVIFPYRNVLHLTVPPGEHSATARIAISPQFPVEIGPIFEPKPMDLPREVDLTVTPARRLGPVSINIWTFGLPEAVWQAYEPVNTTEPAPSAVTRGPLALRYQFAEVTSVRMRVKPYIKHQERVYPLILTVGTTSPQ